MKTRLLKSSRIKTSIISMFYSHVGKAFVAVSDFLNLEHVKSFYRKSCYSFNHFMNEQALSPYKFGNHCATSTSIIADRPVCYILSSMKNIQTYEDPVDGLSLLRGASFHHAYHQANSVLMLQFAMGFSSPFLYFKCTSSLYIETLLKSQEDCHILSKKNK